MSHEGDEAELEERISALEESTNKNATGTKFPNLQDQYLRQVANVLDIRANLPEEEARHRRFSMREMMTALAPQGALEGALVAQMVGNHHMAMECMARAMLPEQTFEGRQLYLKYAQKLQELFTRQIAALDKHRGKGQQKATVEYVHVGAGGQAIVGNVQGGRRHIRN